MIPKVVFKVVEAGNRVLLIVLDGMSWAVCHELLDDIRQEHWFLATLDESSLAASARHRHHPERDAFLPSQPPVGEDRERRCNCREAELRVEPAPEAMLRQEDIPRSSFTRKKSPKGLGG